MLLKLPCGRSASFSEAWTITTTGTGMESEKDMGMGCCNLGYRGGSDVLDVGLLPLDPCKFMLVGGGVWFLQSKCTSCHLKTPADLIQTHQMGTSVHS